MHLGEGGGGGFDETQLLHMVHDACSRVPGSNGLVVGPGFSVAASSDDQGWSVLGSLVVRLSNGPSSEQHEFYPASSPSLHELLRATCDFPLLPCRGVLAAQLHVRPRIGCMFF